MRLVKPIHQPLQHIPIGRRIHPMPQSQVRHAIRRRRRLAAREQEEAGEEEGEEEAHERGGEGGRG
ncbi:MAG: hypothetical protein OHK0035_19170 [Cyanobacteria bacterium J069]